MSGMFETGTACRSRLNPDPILHLLVDSGRGTGWVTWCGGGPASRENTPSQRRCRKCLQLAREDLIECEVASDEESDLDWYLGREVPR